MGKPVGISIDTADKKVIVEFDRALQHIEFSPRQAVEFADAIVKKALTLAPGDGLILPVNLNG